MAGRSVRVLVAAALVLASGVAVAGALAATQGGATPGPATVASTATWSPPVGPPSVDTATTRIGVHENGSATWTVEIRTQLDNETDREDYERFQAEFEDDTGRFLDPFRDRMTGLVETASNVTGREMAARDFSAGTRIQQTPRQWGIVEYQFRWDGFAETTDGAILVGDVFESGYYLAEGDSMVVEAPDSYRVEDPRPTPERDEGTSVRWVGPIDFADQRPSVRLVEAAGTTGDGGGTTPGDGTTGSGDGGTTPAQEGGSNGGLGGLGLPALGLVLLVLAGGGYVVVARRGGSSDNDEGAATGATGDDHSGDAGAGDEGEEEAGDESDDSPAPTGGELVTTEEQVIALLEANDGRMRQADIADRLDWSAPKTSRVLSDMDDEGSIEKLRLGNENVIDLPDDE